MSIESLNLLEEAKAFCKSHGLGSHNIQTIKAAMELGGALVAKETTKEVKEHRRQLGQQREKANRPQ